MSEKVQAPGVETYHFADDGVVPNSPLPLVVYRGALPAAGDRAGYCEALFAKNGWPDAWRNGIYAHHHYHSTAHEVLGIAQGEARVRLGGDNGRTVELDAGDVVVIPAGVAHKREAASADLLVIGAYPAGPIPRSLPRRACCSRSGAGLDLLGSASRSCSVLRPAGAAAQLLAGLAAAPRIEDVSAVGVRPPGVGDEAPRIDGIAGRAHMVRPQRIGDPVAPQPLGDAVVVLGLHRVGVSAVE